MLGANDFDCQLISIWFTFWIILFIKNLSKEVEKMAGVFSEEWSAVINIFIFVKGNR